MFAQIGLDGVGGAFVGPIFLIWLFATSYLLSLVIFGVFVLCVRAWNIKFASIDPRHRNDQGEI